ncbi:hypothetical protein ABK040_007157 [Willaertia magna]
MFKDKNVAPSGTVSLEAVIKANISKENKEKIFFSSPLQSNSLKGKMIVWKEKCFSTEQFLDTFLSSEEDSFIKCFLTCFRLFITPMELLKYTINNYNIAVNLTMKLSYWISSKDFEDDWHSVMKTEMHKLLFCLDKSGFNKDEIMILYKMLSDSISLDSQSEVIFYVPDVISAGTLLRCDLGFLDILDIEIARQLTLIDQQQLIMLKVSNY